VPRKLAVIVLLALLLPSSAAATGSGSNGRIVFTSTRDGNEEIYSANVDGSNAQNLTRSAGADTQPAVSPDGQRIAFVSDRNGRRDLFVMSADGTNATQITDGYAESVDAEPSWSPDGTQLTFASTRPSNESWAIWAVNADGTNMRQLSAGFGVSPAWSPDGTRIAYDAGGSITMMNADGSDAAQLTTGTPQENAPAWSPDGTRLVFGRSPWAGSPYHNLWVVNADGSGARQLTTAGTYDGKAAWSPDGTQIVFQRHFLAPYNSTGLYVVRADGSFIYALTGSGDSYQPDWSVSTGAPPPPPVQDITPPTITVNRPSAGTDLIDTYTVGQLVLADYSCADETGGSGLRHCFGSVANGTAIDTRSVGLVDFYVFAADNAGNAIYKWTKYRVTYPFNGFLAPLTNGAVYDLRPGDSVPLKFSLGADYGLDVLTSATQQEEDCASGQLLGPAASAAGTLTYNGSLGRYLYDWTSDKSWSGTCRAVTLTLRDGTSHRADFRMTK
jgi:dipeptidyl aminopeptidase/acylaminoacyl peptidase